MYRLKPIDYQAFQYIAGQPWPEGVKHSDGHPKGPIYAETIDGDRSIVSGDWLVTGPEGRRLVSDAEFKEKYEEKLSTGGVPKESHAPHKKAK